MDIQNLVNISLGDLSLLNLILLALICGVSGFISGLTGFGFGLFGIFCLWVLTPTVALPLLMALSIINQLFSISVLRGSMIPIREWWPHGPAPFIVGGLFGVPMGLYLLLMFDQFALDEIIGGALFLYAIWLARKQSSAVIPANNLLLNTLFGFLGGVTGGLVANPGPMIVVWASLAGTNKESLRAIIQPFIVCMQIVAFCEFALKGPALGISFFVILLITLPFALVGTRLGVWAFERIQSHHFQRLVVVLLGLSGLSLIIKGRMFWGDFFLSHHINQVM